MSVRILSKPLQEKAIRELNEVPNRVPSDIDHLKKWLDKQYHLIARKDDQTLLNFLRGAKFNLERVKEKIDTYYTARTLIPEMFRNRDPFSAEVQKNLKAGVVTLVMDNSDSTNPVLIVIRWEKIKSENVSLINMLKLFYMLMDIAMNESDSVVINGVYILEDLRGLSMAHISQLTPAMFKEFSMTVGSSYPVRLKGVYLLNMPSIFQYILVMAKSFLKDKVQNRIHAYKESDLSVVTKEIPISLIPGDFGGKANAQAQIEACKEKMESYADWFVTDCGYVTDETKRVGKPQTALDLFGVDGSFRTLPFD